MVNLQAILAVKLFARAQDEFGKTIDLHTGAFRRG